MTSKLQDLLLSLKMEPLTEAQEALFASYLVLLRKWSGKISLTSIQDEDTILLRHFAESIQCARLLPAGIHTMLDYGSGAGFPGLPIAICRPEIDMTLAESQLKKAAFLREVIRTTGVGACVYPARVSTMPRSKVFQAATLRAVDRMESACIEAAKRIRVGGWLCIFCTRKDVAKRVALGLPLDWQLPAKLAGSDQQVLLLGQRRNAGMFHVEH